MQETEELMSRPEVCELMGMIQSAVYKRIADGCLVRAITFGKNRGKFFRHEVEQVRSAMIRGYSRNELRALVRGLHNKRTPEA